MPPTGSSDKQLEDAIDSVCRNIAKGFGADTHGQFAWFLRVSRRSLNEVRDALRSALLKRHATAADLSQALDLIRRLYPALNNFIAAQRPPTWTSSARRLARSHRRTKPPCTDREACLHRQA